MWALSLRFSVSRLNASRRASDQVVCVKFER